jgi:hypothetical protein
VVLSAKVPVLTWIHLNRPQQVPQYDARFRGLSGIVVQTTLNLQTVRLRSFGQHGENLCGLVKNRMLVLMLV